MGGGSKGTFMCDNVSFNMTITKPHTFKNNIMYASINNQYKGTKKKLTTKGFYPFFQNKRKETCKYVINSIKYP